MTNKVNNSMTQWTLTVEEADDSSGDLVLPLPEDLLKQAGWTEGDTIEWTDNGNGTWSMTKATNG
jgi:hypothetical protein